MMGFRKSIHRELSVRELAKLLPTDEVRGDLERCLSGFAELGEATASDFSFVAEREHLPVSYLNQARATHAGCLIVSRSFSEWRPDCSYLICSNPSRSFQDAVERILAEEESVSSLFTGIHPTAIIAPDAILGGRVTIGPYTVIDAGVRIGVETHIGPHCFIGASVVIGDRCFFHSHVAIRERCEIGNRVEIQPSAVIGSCGFGYTTDSTFHHVKLKQLGNVVIGDDVEIGAATTIDRARFGSTTIGSGTKIDNHVQIAHGVVIGEKCLLAAHTAVAGSTTIGSRVVCGGDVAISGHLTIADGVRIGGRSSVSKSLLQAGEDYAGDRAQPLRQHLREQATLRKLMKQQNGLR